MQSVQIFEFPAGNKQNESALLTSTVHSVLVTAAARGMESIAMPLIGTGLAGWPKQLAAEVCLAEVSSFLRAAPSSLRVSEVMLLCPLVLVSMLTSCSGHPVVPCYNLIDGSKHKILKDVLVSSCHCFALLARSCVCLNLPCLPFPDLSMLICILSHKPRCSPPAPHLATTPPPPPPTNMAVANHGPSCRWSGLWT